MHYDITNQVTNSNTLFFKNYKKAFFHIKLTRKIKKNRVSNSGWDVIMHNSVL